MIRTPKPSSLPAVVTPEDSLTIIRTLVAAITERHRKNCQEAVLVGMHLLHLKGTAATSHGGDRRSLAFGGAKAGKSFSDLLDDLDINRGSAYRWMDKAKELAIHIGMDLGKDGDRFPQPGDADWSRLAAAAVDWSLLTSLDRLQIGGTEDDPDARRLEHLMSMAESGDREALAWIDRWRAGQITLARAVCGYGGAEATKGKTRKDPVYVTLDEDGKVGGLVMKSLTTLHNAARIWEGHWDEVPPPAKKQIREAWLQVLALMPEEIKSFKK